MTTATSGLLSASETVKNFLQTMEARDLDGASTFLADGFTMTFPGNSQFTTLQELVDWSKNRYQSVRKTYDKFDEASAPEADVVYCFGTLSGVWLDGSSFDGIRFIDRFTVAKQKLVDQMVWNDMAESLK